MARKEPFISQYTASEIEEILLKADKGPLYPYYNNKDGYWYIFRSEDDFKIWEEDPDQNLTYFWSFEGKSPRNIIVSGLVDTKNLLLGQKGATIDYTFYTEESNGDLNFEGVTATYTFDNSGDRQSFSAVYAPRTTVSVPVDRYLKAGTNSITITLRGRQTNTLKTVVLTYNVIDLSLTGTFEISEEIPEDTPISISYKISGNYQKTMEFYVNGDLASTQIIPEGQGNREFQKNLINNYSPGKYSLQLRAYIELDNEIFYSNILYYEFIITGKPQTEIVISQEYSGKTIIKNTDYVPIQAEQYVTKTIPWGFYSSQGEGQSVAITWNLIGEDDEVIPVQVMTTTIGISPDPLTFIPPKEGQFFLVASLEGSELVRYSLNVKRNTSGIQEKEENLILKLQALGRSNTEPLEEREKWTYGDYQVTFNDVRWNTNSGWDGESLVLYNGATAEINCKPLSGDPQGKGCTIEIEFSTFNSTKEDIELIRVGTKDSGGYLRITSSEALLRTNLGTEIKTNYKNNERLKLAFIINPIGSSSPRLLFIQNNGILERSAAYASADSIESSDTIHLGDPLGTVGLKIYKIRIYKSAISINDEFNNTVVDSSNIEDILEDNNIFKDGTTEISVEKIQAKIPTMLLTGNVDQLISASNKTHIVCDAEWINPLDFSKNFSLENAIFRNHGQSTLGMPVPSIKFWSDKEGSVMKDADGLVIEGGRYSFKDGAMPMKKWVLQANYMDSTGCHNGSILRLFQRTWMNAEINGKHPLRTPPQEYAIEEWPEKMRTQFPYEIRISPDSLPCVVFWRKNSGESYQFLGQYVLMEDKKSDYVFGERSIYNIPNDPFGFVTKKSGYERLWDNSNVLRFEILRNNHDLTKFKDSTKFFDQVGSSIDEDTGEIIEGQEGSLEWEQAFEMIYPDPDDLTEEEYTNNSRVLWYFVSWLCGTYGDHEKFQSEAEEHLDLYKLAAYYVFLMRFGLVDNSVRNAQLKTYDGQTWWLEPWDCDIAIGKRNDGHLVFDPRLDRQTVDPDNSIAYAFAGHECWLWNALEGWDYWIHTIVPQVAQALYKSGLSYQNAVDMMDKEYCDTWCERIYNQSGHYKYIQQYLEGKSDGFLAYLQGKGESHRHWWLKTNMDYWDSKWSVGGYTENPFYFRVIDGTPAGLHQYYTSGEDTYYGWALTTTIQETGIFVERGKDFVFTNRTNLSINDNLNIYSPQTISKVDLHELARYLNGQVLLGPFWNEITGTYLTTLILGITKEDMKGEMSEDDKRPIRNYSSNITIGGIAKLSRLEYFDFQGFAGINYIEGLSECKALKRFYAAGSGLTYFTCSSGLIFEELELPGTIKAFEADGVDWKSLKFFSEDIEEIPIPKDLQTLTLTGMGSSEKVKEFVLTWLRTSEGLSKSTLKITGLFWDNLQYEDLLRILEIPKEKRTLKGTLKVSQVLSLEQLRFLGKPENFGPRIYTPGADLVIESQPASYITSGPTGEIPGDTEYQFTSLSFPLKDLSKTTYGLWLKGGKIPTGPDGMAVSEYGTTLDTKTGKLYAGVYPQDITFQVTSELLGKTSEKTEITVKKIILPGVPSIRTKNLREVGDHNFDIILPRPDYDVSILDTSVEILGSQEFLELVGVGIDRITLNVKKIPQETLEYSLRYTLRVSHREEPYVVTSDPFLLESIAPEGCTLIGDPIIETVGTHEYTFKFLPEGANIGIKNISSELFDSKGIKVRPGEGDIRIIDTPKGFSLDVYRIIRSEIYTVKTAIITDYDDIFTSENKISVESIPIDSIDILGPSEISSKGLYEYSLDYNPGGYNSEVKSLRYSLDIPVTFFRITGGNTIVNIPEGQEKITEVYDIEALPIDYTIPGELKVIPQGQEHIGSVLVTLISNTKFQIEFSKESEGYQISFLIIFGGISSTIYINVS